MARAQVAWRAIATSLVALVVAGCGVGGSEPVGRSQRQAPLRTSVGHARSAALAADSWIRAPDESFTLSGCDTTFNTYVPNSYNPDATPPDLICEGGYQNGNLGKNWNELDLVPHRLEMKNKVDAPTTFNVWIGGDHFGGSGAVGWDVITIPAVNEDLSTGTCTVTAGPEQVLKITGGNDDSIVRALTVTQSADSTCVIDWVQRLALGAHLYSGSSLQSYMFETEDFSQGKRVMSIPVKEILPQTLAKAMAASQSTDHIWSVAKSGPATVEFGDTCAPDAVLQKPLAIKVEWTRGPATPTGDITLNVKIYATNPSSRTLVLTVHDVVYDAANAVLSDTTYPAADIAPGFNGVFIDATFTVPAGSTGIHDVATGTYVDDVTGASIPQETRAEAAVTTIQTKPEYDITAGVFDKEWIDSGPNLDFTVAAPALGAFDGYVAGDWTVGPVKWSYTAPDTGYLFFSKTLRLPAPQDLVGQVKDFATLTLSTEVEGSDVTYAELTVNVTATAKATLKIVKTIPDILTGSETAAFTFDVKDSAGTTVGSATIPFAAGQTEASGAVPNLKLGETYTVSETESFGWVTQASQTITMDACNRSLTFTNALQPATASVKKVSKPAKFEGQWSFTLSGPTGDETVTTDGAGNATFTTNLQEGTYTITETTQAGWDSDGGKDCTFTVDYVKDAGKNFLCTFTNTYKPSVKITKTGDGLSKIGDEVSYSIVVENTSPSGGPAGVPDLACAISDPTIGFTGNATLAAGATFTGNPSFTIPAGASDPFENTASVTCTVVGGTETASGSSTWKTNLFQPGITLEKTADTRLSFVGGLVNYTLKLTNTSSVDSPDLTCTIKDPLLGVNRGVTLASGAIDVTKVAYVIPSGAPDPLENTASVHCNPVGFPNDLDATASWQVNLFQPAVKLTKTGPAYSKVGDVATFSVTIENTSSADSPSLELVSFGDSLVPGVTPSGSCNPLAPGASCSFSYDYMVNVGDPDPLKNTATAHYHPVGHAVDVTSSATWSTDLVHPAFTVAKTCAKQPVSQAGPAAFTITFRNTGDADLHVDPSEGSAFDVAAGGSYSYPYGVDGPFTASVANTVTGTVTLASRYGLDNSYDFTASDTCTVYARAKVLKKVSGGVPAAGQVFTFQLRQGASTTSVGTVLEQVDTDAAGTIAFATDLVPKQTYQICEWVFMGWNTNLTGDGPLFVPNSIIPPALPNPNVDNLTVCANFTVESGSTRTFTVDNTPPPGGRALTIGFWKNWASCSGNKGVGQTWMLDLALGVASRTTANPPGGMVVSAQNAGSGWPNYATSWYLVLKGDPTSTEASIKAAADCSKAVNLLNKSTIEGKKKASDPLFNMTAQLVGAQANWFMGAGINPVAITNVQRAVLLLGKYKFNGSTYSPPKPSAADTSLANCLATQLDNYNNNRTVGSCP